MPLEIEIKLKLDSHAPVLARLAELKAEHVGTVRETNIFFDRPDRSLRKADSGLRVRITNAPTDLESKALLTFKGPPNQAGLRAREAFDLYVTPYEQIVPMLLALGFEQLFLFEKDRDSWMLGEPGEGECLVELDTLPHFGHFLEIEGPSEAAVRAVQRDLQLSHLPPHRASYSQMVSDYLQKQGSTELRFKSVPTTL